MFNKTIIDRSETKVVAVTKEIEKTISPDKVTEMYDAVRDEVEKTIIRAYSIESNLLNGIVIETEPRYETRETTYLLRFILNGKECIRRWAMAPEIADNKNAIYDKAFEFYKGAVAENLMRETINVAELISKRP